MTVANPKLGQTTQSDSKVTRYCSMTFIFIYSS